MGFTFNATLEHASADTDSPAGETLDIVLQLAEATYDRAVRPGRIDVASGTTQVAWNGAEASAQMASFTIAILVNDSETVTLQFGVFNDPGGANQTSWGSTLPPKSFVVIYGAQYTAAFAGGSSIAFQVGGPDGLVDRIDVYAQGGTGSYKLYLYGN